MQEVLIRNCIWNSNVLQEENCPSCTLELNCSKLMWRAKLIVDLFKFLGIERIDSYFGNWKRWRALISSYHLQWCCVIDTFSKDAKCTNQITEWFDFRCRFGYSENNRSAVKRPTGYRSFSTVPDIYSRRIFVYTFCLINICLSLSDDANKIKTLNIERA